MDGAAAVELPIEQHEGAASQALKAASAAAESPATPSPATTAKPLPSSHQPVSPPPQVHPDTTTATPSTPTSTQAGPASIVSPASANATKVSSRAAAPALPIIPAVPRPGSKDAKAATSEGGEELKSEAAHNEEVEVNGAQAEQTESSPAAAALAPAPVPQKPKSWASLLTNPAARLAAAAPGSVASSTNSAGGANVVAVDSQNGVAGMFPRTANSLSEALRGYRVGAIDIISHIEPRGLTNGGNMCYMNSVSDGSDPP
ncbi:hypothetical protein IMZ48_40990 [Candidatus Bathyarchaeota archaeon]|nr:hypothetical protein [Candidatus Bathyarchaeota archaeon]